MSDTISNSLSNRRAAGKLQVSLVLVLAAAGLLGVTAALQAHQALIAAAMVVLTLIGVFIVTTLGRAGNAPLQQTVDVLTAMAAGNFDTPIESGREDAYGVMLRSLAEVQGRLRANLAESHGQLAAISKVQAIIEFQMDGTVVCANENFLQAMGYSLEQIRGQHHSMFVPAEERSSAGYKEFWTRLRHGEYQKARFLRVGRGGRPVWIDASYNPILDSAGKPYKVIKYANDVTPQVLAAQQMELAVAQTQQVTKAASEGNLTLRVATEGQSGDLLKLAESVNSLLISMADVVGKVKVAADEVHRGSRELSEGNTNLSQRTEEQAASLEQTASSMEQMTSTVKQSADNASQANQLAAAAREHAEQGGEVTGKAVEAMGRINEASKRIAAIIGVIDDIAFQTNLLALNAAVEAARAGEQGRGFAVVASEVRALAGRSATAAKEIKALIEDSVRQVAAGSTLVAQSGATLDTIVASVKKVSDIVGEIAAAAREQSAGIEQVNKAVTQMDQMTQQNAALVEEASAAAQAMAEEAGNLNVLLSGYHVDSAAAAAESARTAPSQDARSHDRELLRRFA